MNYILKGWSDFIKNMTGFRNSICLFIWSVIKLNFKRIKWIPFCWGGNTREKLLEECNQWICVGSFGIYGSGFNRAALR